MKLEIISKNYRMSDRLETILKNKINRLDKYFPNSDTPVKIVLNGDDKHCKMEVSIFYHGTQIRSEVNGDTMYYIIDDILPKIERQIVKHRAKLSERYKMPSVQNDDYMYTSEVVKEEKDYCIAKTKKFPIQSVELKEAVENLEMLGHDFYLFVNSATGNVELVYRRKDGSVGHLQPYME